VHVLESLGDGFGWAKRVQRSKQFTSRNNFNEDQKLQVTFSQKQIKCPRFLG
jgi:hypothetical protein